MADPQRQDEYAWEFVLAQVRALKSVVTPAGNQLDHALRTATTLRRRQASPLLVATGLIHDIGKSADLALHAEIGAICLQGVVHPEVVWLVRWHVVAQRIMLVSEPLRSQLQTNPWFDDLQMLIAADGHPDATAPLPPPEEFDAAVRSILLRTGSFTPGRAFDA